MKTTPMTATEKILARASEKSEVRAGENAWVNVDVLMINDITCPGVSGIFKREFGDTAKVYSNLFFFFCLYYNILEEKEPLD